MDPISEYFQTLSIKSLTISGTENWIFEKSIKKMIPEVRIQYLNQSIFFEDLHVEPPKTDALLVTKFIPLAQQDLNKKAIVNMTKFGRKVIFSSQVPCPANSNIAYWPSYWIGLIEDAGFSWDLDFRTKVWYFTLLPPSIIEGLITFTNVD